MFKYTKFHSILQAKKSLRLLQGPSSQLKNRTENFNPTHL